MSGDVQPRKRKDKRRKKEGEYTVRRISSVSVDEDDAGTPPPPLVKDADGSPDITIHIYKESSTGGHWCARIVFFILLAVLVGLIGIIIFEHRGTTDVDTPIESSRWAYVFDGWVDDKPPSHEDTAPHEEKEEEGEEHGHSEEVEEDGHEDEEAEEEDNDEDAEEEDHDEEAETSQEADAEADSAAVEYEEEEGEEDEGEEEEDEEAEGEEEAKDEDEDQDEGIVADDEGEETEGTDDEEDDDIADGDFDQEQEEADEEDQEEEESTRNGGDDEDDEGIERDEDIRDHYFEDMGVLEELDVVSEEKNDNQEEDALNEGEDEFDDNTDMENVSEESMDVEMPKTFPRIPGVNEIDDDGPEPLEEVEGVEPEEITDEPIEPEVEEEIEEEESASVPVKFGVGVALVVAAHFVLVRRWNNAEELSEFNNSSDLSRRNTIVPPVPIQEALKTSAKSKQQASAEKQVRKYEELRSKYNKLGTDSENKRSSAEQPSSGFEEKLLKNVIATTKDSAQVQPKLISSSEEDEGEELETSEGERLSGAEEDEGEEYEDEEIEDEEEEEEEIEHIDDSELIAKLEAKYGKLPTPQYSEEEEEEDDEELDDEEELDEDEEEEDDEMEGWKRVKVPRQSAVAKPSQKSAEGDTKKVEGGARTHNINISDIS